MNLPQKLNDEEIGKSNGFEGKIFFATLTVSNLDFKKPSLAARSSREI